MKVEGKGGISATVIADSISENGIRITTLELEYPRFIHSEFMTHRMFSRNASSSRAIPIENVIEAVHERPAKPIHWGKNQSGMQAKGELDVSARKYAEGAWELASNYSARIAEFMKDAGAHKQIVNRILEPFQFIKVVVTATEYENFFQLRCHADAQPEMQELANCMADARASSEPFRLYQGEWHTPYVNSDRGDTGKLFYFVDSNVGDYHVSLEDALKISSSCCAQVSYRLLDNSIEKAVRVYEKLVESHPVHASPFEHQATPVDDWGDDEGITHHMMLDGRDYWSGNFRGFIQHRQLLNNNVQRG